jgi:PIN domain nuclease of toxin-antitoxin system
MRLLLDTHTFFWLINGSSKLTQEARKLIENPNNEPFFSVASLWETAIKISIGKLSLDEPFEAILPRHMEINGTGLLSIDFQHAVIVAKLPFSIVTRSIAC